MLEEPVNVPSTETGGELPPLPFTYQRTQNPEEAQYSEWRVSPVYLAGEKNDPKTDESIIESVKRQRKGKDWFTYDSWREKGMPKEQLEFQVGGSQITVYNFSGEKPFTDEHVEKAQKVLSELSARFPQILTKIRWILIDDIAHASFYGDPELYPLNGSAQENWRSFTLLPRGMELIPHRVSATSNFEGTLAHETTHLIDDEFKAEWGEKFKWQHCLDYPDDWEVRPTPDGTEKDFLIRLLEKCLHRGNFHYNWTNV